MDDKIKDFTLKCIKCKRIVKKPNKLVPIWEGSETKWCLICIEEQTHKDIIDYLEGKRSVTFMCGEGGCDVFIPERDYLSCYSNKELLAELQKRSEGEE